MKSTRFFAAAIATATALVSTAFAVTESEPNDVRAFADTVGSFPATLNGTLANDAGSFGTYDDYWSFTATAGSTYDFAASGGSFVFPMDIGLIIENGSGTQLTLVDSLGDNAGENLSWQAPSDGTYYLAIYEATATLSTSTYTVNITETAGTTSVDDWHLY